MTQSNARSLPKLPAEAIRLAHLLDSFFKTNKTWTGLSHPDQRVLIEFIAQKYDMGSTLTANHITRYPRIWAREEHRVTEAIQKTVDLASPLLDGSLRSVLRAKSIFDMPVELMELIVSDLSDSELSNLCRANRDLYSSGWLSRRGMQDLRAFERSLQGNMEESFIKAVEALSDVPWTVS
ncbi:uncharacterized protein N7518_002255 [Penicillium psychrosexuale]|uniref:uncharacterized protein n=1 Tax=Penicillium psychrosexuale TaxID=1002107 RepID=UPI002545A666|nr:uncharacterized protein N7518_002255 [Penicillium psychrosexuale]KAJ5800187.1 hypothetical protein N7518_002255 [Penicillium psychrosexuale]